MKQSATYLLVTTVYSATDSTPENDAPQYREHERV